MRGIDLNWAGAERTFLLDIDLLKALEDRCDAGPAWILRRLSTEQWRVADVIETIRFSLEGGGMEKEDARKLVDRHFEDRPLIESVLTARMALAYSIMGEGDRDSGEAKPAEE